jgi:hypothetical protein
LEKALSKFWQTICCQQAMHALFTVSKRGGYVQANLASNQRLEPESLGAVNLMVVVLGLFLIGALISLWAW